MSLTLTVTSNSAYGPDKLPDQALAESLEAIVDQVAAGLPDEAERLTEARANDDFYQCNNHLYIEKREGESQKDFEERPKRCSYLVRKAVQTLSGKLYSPPPSRTLEPEDVSLWLNEQHARGSFDAVMASADRKAVLNDVAAIQVVCTGDPDRPVRWYTYGANEFAAWCPKDDPTNPWAVCTIAIERPKKDKKRRVYTLYTASEVITFATEPMDLSQTSGGVVAKMMKKEPNPYGMLPFAYLHNETPVDTFWGGGIGSALRRVNQEIDRELSDLAQTIQTFSIPDKYGRNLPAAWREEKKVGRVVRLPTDAGANGDIDPAGQAEIMYLQPELNVDQIWLDIEKTANACLYELGVPLSAVRMDQQGPTSGIQVIAEQIPLLDYLKARQAHVEATERDLARLTLAIAGIHYEQPVLTAAAESAELSVVWPTPAVPVPTPERNEDDLWELQYGFSSELEILARRKGLTRDEAIKHMERIAEDRKVWQEAFPDSTPGQPQQPPMDPMMTAQPVGAPTDGQVQAQDQQQADAAQAQAQG